VILRLGVARVRQSRFFVLPFLDPDNVFELLEGLVFHVGSAVEAFVYFVGFAGKEGKGMMPECN
jgi:hypothetical protein